MSTVHVVYDGRNEDIDLESLFPSERLTAIGVAEGTEISVGNLTEQQVKTALAQYYDVGANEFEDHYVELNSRTNNATVRPNTTFGRNVASAP